MLFWYSTITPLAFSDHLSPLLRSAFPDREIAKSYASASTKTTCMIDGAIAPYFKAALIEMMKNNAYSLATDGSNDTGIEPYDSSVKEE